MAEVRLQGAARRGALLSASIVVLSMLATVVGPSGPAGAVGAPATGLISRPSGVAGKANGPALTPSVSGDGRWVAFSSTATNLDPADADATSDVYVRDQRTNVTTLVSRATGPAGAKGNGTSTSPAISADGRRVAFVSVATNLDPADADVVSDVFVRDLVAGTTTLASRATGAAGAKGSGNSGSPTLSGDGSRVAFDSVATNLDPADADITHDVFLRDLTAGTTTLISRATGIAGAKGNATSLSGEVSADGASVAFSSAASNLHADDADGFTDIYVRDLRINATALVSRASYVEAPGPKGNANSAGRPTISDDGRMVAFASAASNLDPADMDVILDVFVYDRQYAITTLISRASGSAGAKGNAFSANADVSGNGRSVAFASAATNLDPADTDAVVDVFVRNLYDRTTTLASRAGGATGAKGNGTSGATLASLSINADGRYVVFESAATNLDPADTDGAPDVFARTLALPEVTGATPPRLRRGFTRTVALTGSGFTIGAEASFGAGITVNSVTVDQVVPRVPAPPDAVPPPTQVLVNITVAGDAPLGLRSVTVTNPPGDSATAVVFEVVDTAGYWLVARDGGIFSFDATFSGSTGNLRLNQPIVGMAVDPDGRGYWFVAADGGVFAFDAGFYGSMGATRLNQPVVGMAAAPDGKGYWLVARDGGIFAFGSAQFYGSTGNVRLNQPIVGMAAEPDGVGYWFVAADGGVFSFQAVFHGSMGATRLNQPVVGMAADPDGKGYWLVARDGGIFSFDAPFSGSTGNLRLNQPIVGMAADPDGRGYWFVAADGGVFAFDAVFHGSMGATRLNQPVVGMAAA